MVHPKKNKLKKNEKNGSNMELFDVRIYTTLKTTHIWNLRNKLDSTMHNTFGF